VSQFRQEAYSRLFSDMGTGYKCNTAKLAGNDVKCPNVNVNEFKMNDRTNE